MVQTLTPEQRQEAVRLAWESGRLRFKLQPFQQEAYDKLTRATPEDVFFLLCHRGFGKTFIGCTKALEASRTFTDANVLIISSTLKKLRKIVRPAFDTLLEDCPPNFKPRYNTQDSYYEFPESKMRVHLIAAEKGHIEDIRGIHNVVLVLIDEAAFFGYEEDSYPLDYVIESILNPMFIRTKSKPRIVMMTTPPEVPGHPTKKYFEIAKVKGNAAIYDINHTDVPAEKIAEQKKRNLDPLAWKREMLCEWVVDPSKLAVPEWNTKTMVMSPRRDPYDPFYHRFHGLDWGYKDHTAILFATHNFRKGRLEFDGELTYSGKEVRSDLISERITLMNEDLWGADFVRSDKFKIGAQIADSADPIATNELNKYEGMHFTPVHKADTLEAMLNEFRILVAQGKIVVRPECQMLIYCLENAFWDRKRQKLDRDAFAHHFDHLMAAVYLARMVDWNHNPIPKDFMVDGVRVIEVNFDKTKAEGKSAKSLESAFGGGRRRFQR